MFEYAALTILFPLAGFIFLGIFGNKIKSEKIIGIVASCAIAISFLFAVAIFFNMLHLDVSNRTKIISLFNWISAFTSTPNAFSVNYSLQIDQLSIIMTLVVTGVGLLIHIYSIGYMHGDKAFWRFFAYLNLFIFAMLNLILADNFLVMFLGWEGVGLCSYLLIGFWYEKQSANDAAKKAFIVNRIGDLGFLLGIFLIYSFFGTLNYSTVFTQASFLSVGNKTVFFIALLLFVGAVGKSAQIPLYVWLPDAMAGPTPVSALIHAATMVTAGVYMIARCSILYALAPLMLNIVVVVGIVTAIYSASIALAQNDIKKILAYSTISQLGLMFLAMGVGAFSSGIFHLITHAFFKALMFLCAGAVIHSLHNEQDINKMGGLKDLLPNVYKLFFVGAAAISGIPPFAGFFSKDEILWNTFGNSTILWAVAMLCSILTTIYIFRLIFVVFDNQKGIAVKEIIANSKEHKLHSVPKVMMIPLFVLGFLSLVGGVIGIPHYNLLDNWLSPIFLSAKYKIVSAHHPSSVTEFIIMFVSAAIVVTVFFVTRFLFIKRTDVLFSIRKKHQTLHRILLNGYFVENLYDSLIIAPFKKISEIMMYKWIDVKLIDGFVNNFAKLIENISLLIRKVNNGFVQFYAVVFIAGLVFVIAWLFFI